MTRGEEELIYALRKEAAENSKLFFKTMAETLEYRYETLKEIEEIKQRLSKLEKEDGEEDTTNNTRA